MSQIFVCIGHSHVNALALARAPDLDAINLRDIEGHWLEGQDGWRLREDLAQRVFQGGGVFMLMGGGAPVMLGLLEYSRQFDFVLPSAPQLPLDETREIVPVDAVRARLLEESARHIATIPGIVRAASAPVIQLHPPPPLADEAVIRPLLPMDGEIRVVVACRWLRYKLWRLHCEVMEAACEPHGVLSRPPPRAALDGEGFLHPDLHADGVHGNAAYGRLVLDDLRAAGLMTPAP